MTIEEAIAKCTAKAEECESMQLDPGYDIEDEEYDDGYAAGLWAAVRILKRVE